MDFMLFPKKLWQNIFMYFAVVDVRCPHDSEGVFLTGKQADIRFDL
jgi:hypothetical protein